LVAILIFGDNELLDLNSTSLIAPSFMASDLNSVTHEIVTALEPIDPLVFVNSALSYDGVWSISNETLYSQFEVATKERKQVAGALKSGVAKATQWHVIKAKRDSRKAAGAQVGAYWFHTDADSRIQQLGLKDQARDVLAAGGTTATVLQKLGQDIPWQTMSGASIPMTVQLSFAVVAAVGDLDAMCHFLAGQHKAAMEAADDPAAYDFSAGWPTSFQDESV
jgi:hypothetical protein